MAQTILFLVKTGIFYEFLKHGLSAPWPGWRKTGSSDVKPGHLARIQNSYKNNHWINLRILIFRKAAIE